MATNPFEDENGTYLVLVNDEKQHSLWPADIDVPAGWTVALTASTRQTCLDYVEANWTDMRPASVRRRKSDAGFGDPGDGWQGGGGVDTGVVSATTTTQPDAAWAPKPASGFPTPDTSIVDA